FSGVALLATEKGRWGRRSNAHVHSNREVPSWNHGCRRRPTRLRRGRGGLGHTAHRRADRVGVAASIRPSGRIGVLVGTMLTPRLPIIEARPSILRIAVGGAAGIVIGWFRVPAPSHNAELAAVTSTPFALAFLAGFSIDILFSLLDRLNRTIADDG